MASENSGRKWFMGGSPGLVVDGGYSKSKGCEFKSQQGYFGGYFSHLFVVKIVLMFVWKNQKEAGYWPLKIDSFKLIHVASVS